MRYGSYGGTTSCMEVGRLFVLPCMFMAVWYAMVAMDPFPPDIHEFADETLKDLKVLQKHLSL